MLRNDPSAGVMTNARKRPDEQNDPQGLELGTGQTGSAITAFCMATQLIGYGGVGGGVVVDHDLPVDHIGHIGGQLVPDPTRA